MTPWLLVPVKALTRGKSRLGGVLDTPAREALNARFLRHTLDVAAVFPGASRALVVTDCDEVRAIALRAGAGAIVQSSTPGLDAAVHDGLCELRRRGARDIVVLMNDLPMVRPADLAGLADAMRTRQVVLCPSRSGDGTNAVALPAAVSLRLSFGGSSLERLRREAMRSRCTVALHHNARIALDVDTPRDLRMWLHLDNLAKDVLADNWLQ